MNAEELEAKVAEMRAQYPNMFAHPELAPNEVWIGDQIYDVVWLNASIYRSKGIPSARVGTVPVMKEIEGMGGTFQFRGVFMDLKELILAEDKLVQETKMEAEVATRN